MSSANRQRRQQNREARVVAAEEHLRRSKRQRILLVSVGLGLAVIVGAVLVARSVTDDGDSSASASNTTTTSNGSVAGKPCVKLSENLPEGAPNVPVQVGPPPTKLIKKDLTPGTGAVVQPGAEVTVDYIGVACSTGKIFDSSYQRNAPYTTALGDVVLGWQQGIPGMRVGGTRLLGVPSALGYQSAGSPPTIAPDEALWFVVKVEKTTPPAAAGASGPTGATGTSGTTGASGATG